MNPARSHASKVKTLIISLAAAVFRSTKMGSICSFDIQRSLLGKLGRAQVYWHHLGKLVFSLTSVRWCARQNAGEA